MSQDASEDEALIRARMTRSSFADRSDDYREADVGAIVQWYAPDAISMPAHHHALYGQDEIRDWYVKRTGHGHERNAISEVDSVDIVGDIAVVVGHVPCDPCARGRGVGARSRWPLPRGDAQGRR